MTTETIDLNGKREARAFITRSGATHYSPYAGNVAVLGVQVAEGIKPVAIVRGKGARAICTEELINLGAQRFGPLA